MVLFRHWQWFWVIFHVHHTFPYSPGQINVGDIWRLNLKHGTWGFAKKNLVLQHFRDRSMHSCECIVMKVFRPTKDEIIFHPINILLISRSLHFFFSTAWPTPPVDANAAPKEPNGQGKVDAPEGQALKYGLRLLLKKISPLSKVVENMTRTSQSKSTWPKSVSTCFRAVIAAKGLLPRLVRRGRFYSEAKVWHQEKKGQQGPTKLQGICFWFHKAKICWE